MIQDQRATRYLQSTKMIRRERRFSFEASRRKYLVIARESELRYDFVGRVNSRSSLQLIYGLMVTSHSSLLYIALYTTIRGDWPERAQFIIALAI